MSENLAPQPAAELPPAGATVAKGTKTERESELERDLEIERKIRKDREVTISHLQDENHRLKAVPTPTTQPAPKKKGSGWTFFDDEDED